MKLYRVIRYDPAMGETWEWFGTKREAEQLCRHANSDEAHEGSDATLEVVDFPTKKSALIRWLNNHAGDNNG
jgi:hypothetical protein